MPEISVLNFEGADNEPVSNPPSPEYEGWTMRDSRTFTMDDEAEWSRIHDRDQSLAFALRAVGWYSYKLFTDENERFMAHREIFIVNNDKNGDPTIIIVWYRRAFSNNDQLIVREAWKK